MNNEIDIIMIVLKINNVSTSFDLSKRDLLTSPMDISFELKQRLKSKTSIMDVFVFY